MTETDSLTTEALIAGDDDRVRSLLAELCALTQMGFAALARVTEDRWIACQVVDKIGFGLDPGGELEVQTTICNDIRREGQRVIIDDVGLDGDWRNHPVPRLYGFQSYVSLPIYLDDGSFFGTLCAIDPKPRVISGKATVSAIEAFARKMAAIVSARLKMPVPSPN
jgi:GAF domain-containing protein